MSEALMADKEPAPKKSIIPYYFVAFFAVVVAVNGVLVYVSQSTWTGLETKNHYLKGLSYNENLDGAKAAKALQWQQDFQVTSVSGLVAKLSLSLKDKNGKALRAADVEVTAIRPTHHGYDKVITMQETTPGFYEGVVEFPLEGQWDLKRIVQIGADNVQEVERFFVSQGEIK